MTPGQIGACVFFAWLGVLAVATRRRDRHPSTPMTETERAKRYQP